MRSIYKTLASGLALGVLLSACGGGSDSPEPTPLNASLTVSGSSDINLNGVYSTTALNISAVEKNNPIGGDPEVCSFRFSGLGQAGSQRLMDGDIRYIPGTSELRVVFVSISGVEFNSRTPAAAVVDKAGNQVNFTAKPLSASSGNGSAIAISGSLPMRTGRPEGC
ncbi:MAG: hypothetical protein EOO54_07155 [Haliea sp.]|nr:MAG: hypothetical protein EOO54_07155 [Haliea sp.]